MMTFALFSIRRAYKEPGQCICYALAMLWLCGPDYELSMRPLAIEARGGRSTHLYGSHGVCQGATLGPTAILGVIYAAPSTSQRDSL